MNKKEFSLFVMALRTYYPKDQILPNNQAMELWYGQLKDIPYHIAEAALNKWVAINKWSPTIADIREMVSTILEGEVPDWSCGWEQIITAIHKYGIYHVEDAMKSFDPITRKCVERIGFKNICLSENINADRANFRIIYEQFVERKKKDARIPMHIKDIISDIQDKRMLIEMNR